MTRLFWPLVYFILSIGAFAASIAVGVGWFKPSSQTIGFVAFSALGLAFAHCIWIELKRTP